MAAAQCRSVCHSEPSSKHKWGIVGSVSEGETQNHEDWGKISNNKHFKGLLRGKSVVAKRWTHISSNRFQCTLCDIIIIKTLLKKKVFFPRDVMIKIQLDCGSAVSFFLQSWKKQAKNRWRHECWGLMWVRLPAAERSSAGYGNEWRWQNRKTLFLLQY